MTLIPTTEQCMELLDEFGNHETLKKHSIIVNEIAMMLAKKLAESGENIDLELVNAASLLHDLDKLHTLNDTLNHGKLGEQWLKERQHSKVGKTALMHNMQDIIKNKSPTWEEKIVNYADKRVQYDKIVSLEKRFAYIKERYKELFQPKHEEYAKQIEKQIFNKLDISPGDIT